KITWRRVNRTHNAAGLSTISSKLCLGDLNSMTNNGTHYDSQFLVQHVAVLIETETSWGGRVIRGIAHFAEKHTHWHLLIDPRDHEQRSAVPDGWEGDGIIARVTNRTQWQQIREKNLPVVNV